MRAPEPADHPSEQKGAFRRRGYLKSHSIPRRIPRAPHGRSTAPRAGGRVPSLGARSGNLLEAAASARRPPQRLRGREPVRRRSALSPGTRPRPRPRSLLRTLRCSGLTARHTASPHAVGGAPSGRAAARTAIARGIAALPRAPAAEPAVRRRPTAPPPHTHTHSLGFLKARGQLVVFVVRGSTALDCCGNRAGCALLFGIRVLCWRFVLGCNADASQISVVSRIL